MQGMDRYHDSHGDARVLSPERDSPYLGFCCHRRMEFQTKTLFSAFLLGGRFCFDRFYLRFLKFSVKDSSSCIPIVMHSDLCGGTTQNYWARVH